MINKFDGTRIDLLHSLPKRCECAELGVFCGDFSREILKICHPHKLYLVDLFQGEVVSGDHNGENYRTVDMHQMRWDLEVEFSRRHEVYVVRSDSVTWLLTQRRDSLDFVYIDTQHSYSQTIAELSAAYNAVRSGGYILGHDFHAQQFPGVVEAVSRFLNHFRFNATIWTGDKLPSFQIKIEKPLES